MLVRSGAGEFELSFERVEMRGSTLVLVGKMGVWEAETLIVPADLARLLRLTLRLRVLLWALASPLYALRERLRLRRREGAG